MLNLHQTKRELLLTACPHVVLEVLDDMCEFHRCLACREIVTSTQIRQEIHGLMQRLLLPQC
jgi:hypothetical protein